MMRQNKIRWLVRSLFLCLFLFLLFSGPLPLWASKILPILSPLVVFHSALAQRFWPQALFWLIPPGLIVLAALWRGRWFCRWICPAGTVFDAVSKLGMKKSWRWNISGVIFWMILSSSLIGFPVLLFMDPLSSFNRIGMWGRPAYTAASLVPGILVPAFILLAMIRPSMWCIQICPLGYSFDLFRRLKRNGLKASVNRERRNFLVGVGVGVPVAWLMARTGKSPLPVLPPGAVAAGEFGSVCSRCYACIDACPTHILRVDAPGRMRLLDWFQPEMNPNEGTCEEFCYACTQVCPTGAIRNITEKEKRYQQIGVAEVIRHACLAWEDQEYCMVCDEFCPYNAIETEMSAQGIPQPVVIPDRCRGCGYCQNKCPAIRDGKAIIVRGIPEQKTLQPNDLYNY